MSPSRPALPIGLPFGDAAVLLPEGAATPHRRIALILGDMAALLLVTIVGFMTHGETLSWRLFTTFLPLCAAWALVAPWLGVYRPQIYRRAALVWRAALAMVLAAPMAALLRALWLNASIIPTFVIALGLSAAVGMTLWRLGWAWWSSRRGDHGG
jgi:hypothetical protein